MINQSKWVYGKTLCQWYYSQVDIYKLNFMTLQTELYDTTNIERVKKRVMKYHWLEDTMFFQNQVVPRATKREC